MATSERITTPISDKELARRWVAVRAEMEARGIDALVMQSADDWLGGYVKWFTDIPAHNAYPRSVVFHKSDLMTVVEMGAFGSHRILDGTDPVHRGVGEIFGTPSFVSCDYTHAYDVDLVIDALKHRGYGTVGLLGPGALPHLFVSRLTNALGGKTEIVDATEFVDRLKAIKSEEEMVLIRRAAEMQDRIFETVLKKAEPGMRDVDVTALVQYEGQLLGSEQGILLACSAPLGTCAPFQGRHLQGRTIREGEHLSLLIENNGPGGFYTELGRTIVFGKAQQELVDAVGLMREAQLNTLAHMKPGTPCRDIHAAHNRFLKEHGYPPETRLYCHGQGYDLVERPLIRDDETMSLEAGMSIVVHPGVAPAAFFAVVCDNYLVGDDGPGNCLHKTAKKIFEL